MIPSVRHPHITWPALAAELEREAAARSRAYPAMIEQGRMTEDDAQQGRHMVAAWAEDLARLMAYLALPAPRPHAMPHQPRTRGFTWAERRAALDREFAQRARLYPRWIASARLDPAEAQRRIDCLTVLAELYDDGLDWHDSFGTRPIFTLVTATRIDDPAQAEAIDQWLSHVHHTLTARSGADHQQELAL